MVLRLETVVKCGIAFFYAEFKVDSEGNKEGKEKTEEEKYQLIVKCGFYLNKIYQEKRKLNWESKP